MENQIFQEDIEEKLEELNSRIQSCYNMPSDLQAEVEDDIQYILDMLTRRNEQITWTFK